MLQFYSLASIDSYVGRRFNLYKTKLLSSYCFNKVDFSPGGGEFMLTNL